MLVFLCLALALGQDWRTADARNAQPDMALAKNLLLSCYTNYCGSESNATKSCYWCLKVPGYIDGSLQFLSRFGDASTGTSGMVVYNLRDRYVAVIWQGTSNVDGALVDAKIYLQRIPGASFSARAHTGFLNGATRASFQVFGLVQQGLRLCGASCRLIVTGHSLGASLAYIGAMNLARQTRGSVPMELYTFGAARVFNGPGARWFRDSFLAPNGPIIASFRFVNGGDIVTNVPPPLLFYAHVGREVWLKLDGTVRIAQDWNGEDPNGAATLALSRGPDAFKDHNMYFGYFLNEGASHRCLYSSHDNVFHFGGFVDPTAPTPAPTPLIPRILRRF